METRPSLTPEILINKDIDDENWNKLLEFVPIANENTISFLSCILLDNGCEVCGEKAGEDENAEISVQELVPTEFPMDKLSQADVLAIFHILIKFSQKN